MPQPTHDTEGFVGDEGFANGVLEAKPAEQRCARNPLRRRSPPPAPDAEHPNALPSTPDRPHRTSQAVTLAKDDASSSPSRRKYTKHVDWRPLKRYHSSSPRPKLRSGNDQHMTMPLPKFFSFGSWGPKNTLNRGAPSSSPAPQPPRSDDSPEPPAKRTKLVVDDASDAPKPRAGSLQPDVEEVPEAPKPEVKRVKLDVEELPDAPKPETKRLKLDVEELPGAPKPEPKRPLYPPSISSIQSRYGSRYAGSVRSSGSRAIQSNVNEFRDTERRAMSGRRGGAKRQRRPKGFVPANNSAGDPHLVEDSDDEDEVNIIQPGTPMPRRRTGMSLEEIRELKELEQSAGTRRSHRSPLEVQARSPRPLAVLKRKPHGEVMGDAKRQRFSSPDELTGPGDPSDYQPSKTAIRTSTSESLRGAIKPAMPKVKKGTSSHQSNMEKDLEKAKRIIGPGLRIRHAACGQLGFPGPDSAPGLELTLGMHDVSAILLPTNVEGEVAPSYAYLSVDLKRVSKIRMPDSQDSSIVAVHRSNNLAQSAGALLFLEFTKPAERQVFMEWAEEFAPAGFTKAQIMSDDAAKLQTQLSHALDSVVRSKVLRDADVEQPADVQLMQRNRQRQTQSAASSNAKVPTEDRPRSREKLKDAMRTSRPTLQGQAPAILYERRGSSGGRATRAKISQAPEGEMTPAEERWSEQNPRWADNWQQALVFPPNKAVRDRAVVEMPDIPRLDEGEYLNDNLVWFGLRYLKDKLEKSNPELAQRFHFFNTFFYGNLKPAKSGGSINYNTVKEWTSKVDLFTKDFIVVPICEYSHWYLAIIYNAPKLVPPESNPSEDKAVHSNPKGSPELGEGDTKAQDRVSSLRREADAVDSTALVETGVRRLSISDSDMGHTASPNGKTAQGNGLRPADAEKAEVIDLVEAGPDETEARPTSKRGQSKKPSSGSRKRDPNQPKIITLDSLGLAHSPTCQILRQYLVAELQGKKGIEIPDPGSLGMTAKGIPKQENYCDCGLYVIGYVDELIKDPDGFVRQLLQNELSEWDFDALQLRETLRNMIFGLQQQQQEKDRLEREAKQQRRRQAALAKKDQSQSASSGEAPRSGEESSKSTSPATDLVTESEDQGKQDGRGTETKSNAPPPPSSATLEAGSSIDEVQVVEPENHGAETAKTEDCVRAEDTAKTKESSSGERRKAWHPQPVLEPALPGSYPSSPTRPARRMPVLATTATGPPEHSGSDATEKGFLSRLRSSPTSRGETPDNPVDLDDSQDLTEEVVANLDSERQKMVRGDRTKAPRTRIEVQIPSRRIHREMESWRAAKTPSEKSPYFDKAATAPPRAERGTVTAKLVDTSKPVDMVDLSD